MAGTDYEIDYNDERFTNIESEKNDALTEIEGTYDNMIGQTDKFYQDQIDASKQWADKQTQIQNEQTDFAIEKLEQQQEQAHKDYLKEQAGAYVDWQKQSNPYGAKAEQLASNGLTNTGYSESSQVAMYNQYQNRVATAREIKAQADLNFENGMKEARLQNSAVLAEIHFKAYQEQLELALQGFQYKNNLVLEQANKKLEVDQMYYNRYQDVLQQINTENAMAEEIRQFNQDYQLRVDQFNKEYDQRLREFDEQIRQFNEEMARIKKKDEQEHQLELEKLELAKQEAQRAKAQFQQEMAFKEKQLQEEKRQFDATHSSSGSGGGGGGGGGTAYTGKSSVGSKIGSQIGTAVGNAVSIAVPVNMQSVLDLGYGPISSSYLSQLEARGKITSYVKNGQRYFAKKVQATGLNKYLKTM